MYSTVRDLVPSNFTLSQRITIGQELSCRLRDKVIRTGKGNPNLYPTKEATDLINKSTFVELVKKRKKLIKEVELLKEHIRLTQNSAQEKSEAICQLDKIILNLM